MRLRLGAAVVLLCVAMVPPALAAPAPHPLKGVALVIGETDYVRLPLLTNPDKDARDVDHMLDDLGFDVTRALNVQSADLRSKIDGFIAAAKGADVALVYYAGHGIEAGGKDYIMGIDADISSAQAADETLVSLEDTLARLKAVVPVTIMLLDACRTNPFTGQQTLDLTDDNAPVAIGQQGLEIMRGPTAVAGSKDSSGLGMVIGFSASPGQSALDGPAGENSPYASALLQHLSAGGYSFGDIMTLVTQEVYVDTGARQLPWTSSSLSKILYFGRDADAPQGDDAAILGDRRKLLLDIANVPVEQKAYVEAVATNEDLKLADLYSMLEIINTGKGKAGAGDQQSLIDVAKRVREVLDDPILSGAPSDPELARLDALATKAIAAGAFKRAFDYRQQEAQRAAQIEKGLDAKQASVDQQQADIDAQRKELAGVYARVAEAAMYNLNTAAETDAYKRAAKQSDLFDKTISLRLRLRAANALADTASQTLNEHDGRVAIALYQDILKELDKSAQPVLWADTQLRMGNTMWETANRANDNGLDKSAVIAARAALEVFTAAGDFRRWSAAQRLLGQSLRNTDHSLESMQVLTALLAATPKAKYPLDWAQAEQDYGHLLYDLGTNAAGTDLLLQAVTAYQAAGTAFKAYDSGGYEFMLALAGDAQVKAALRLGDRSMMLAGLDGQRRALALYAAHGAQNLHHIQYGNQSSSLGRSLVAVGLKLDDSALVKEGLAVLGKGEKVITDKTQRVDYAHMRESDGDGLSYLGSHGGGAKALTAAVAAYAQSADSYQAMGDSWGLDYERVRQKKIKLQIQLGQKVSPRDKVLASIPDPAPIDVSAAKTSVSSSDQQPLFLRWSVDAGNVTLNSKPQHLFLTLYSDFAQARQEPGDLILLRLVIRVTNLDDERSRAADYSSCGDLAYQPGEVRLHYGDESVNNACVLSKMAPADAAYWRAIWADLPGLVHNAVGGDTGQAASLDALFAVKPAGP